MHFGASLRLLRVEAGFSLKSLGQAIGVSPAYLSRVENGHDAPPTADRLRSIADVFGLPVDLLVDLTRGGSARASRLGASGVADTPSFAARALVAEVTRRRLGPAQIARVLDFVAREFPESAAPTGPVHASLADLLTPDRVLLGVRVGRVEDALDLAAMRLAPAGASEALAAALHARERALPSAVGAGLLLPHAAGYARTPTGCLVLLDTPLAAPTPDDVPLRAILVVVGLSGGPSALAVLARAARLADPELLAQLAAAGSAREVLAGLGLVR